MERDVVWEHAVLDTEASRAAGYSLPRRIFAVLLGVALPPRNLTATPDDYLPSTSIRTFNGAAVRITRPELFPLLLPKLAPYTSRFHSAGEPMPLYASTSLATALAAWASEARSNLHALAAGGVETRVSDLEIDSARLLDLTDQALMPQLGFTPDDLFLAARSAARHDLGIELASRARAAGAEGLLVPSRHTSEGTDLIIFADALHRVTVRNTRVVELGLADATDDIRVRELLEADEQLVGEFVAGIENGNFERWLAQLDLPAELATGLRALAEAVAP